MSSGDDRTHHWLLTSPGPGAGSVEEDSMLHDDPDPQDDPSADVSNTCGDPTLMPYGCSTTEEGLSSSPVTSLDLDRDSPLGGAMDDDDDPGPPSIETQPPDQGDDLEVSGITSTWINSGGSQYGSSSSHPGLGYSLLNSQLPDDTADSTGLSQMPGLEPGDFGIGPPVYGPEMPPPGAGPFNSPLHESDVQHYIGDILDENGVSGLCGLRNLGNTCFMAAGIQCLVNTPPIAQYFFSTAQYDNRQSLDTLAGRFSQLTHKIWSGKYSALKPSEFKDAFGMQWRDFRDYRQHDCQEFVTLLLEALRKQMCVIDDGGGGDGGGGREGGGGSIQSSHKDKSLQNSDNRTMASCSSSSSNNSMNNNNNIYESNSSAISISALPEGELNRHMGNIYSNSPPSPHSSVMCPTSPTTFRGPESHYLKQTLDLRTDAHEESKDLDSGAASPKSSVSSSSTDAHLVNFRLQPIPEEVRQALNPGAAATHTSCDDLSLGTTSCADAESVTSDVSDPAEVGGTVSVGSLRRYNQLGTGNSCDTSLCDSSTTTQNLVSFHGIEDDRCDSSSSVGLEKNQLQSMRRGLSSGKEKINSDNESSTGPSSPGGSSSVSGNLHLSMVKLEDIMKESKTSNVNVLVKENPTNNEFLYDSEKYAKYEKTRLKNSVDNLSKSGNKRLKEVNLLHEKRECFSSGIDLPMHSQDLSEDHLGLNKRIRLDEKNLHYEVEKRCGGSNVESTVSGSGVEGSRVSQAPSVSSAETHQAMDSWRTFVGDTQSTVVDTFYGQFKSSLVCSVCSHTSVKYDPFGTLSVPLPYANQIQLSVTYVPSDCSTPTRYLVTLCKVSYISDLKTGLCNLIGDEDFENVVTAEVFDNHIARIVEDTYMTKFLNHTIRNIYAFQLNKPPPSAQEDFEAQGEGSSSEGGATGENSDAGGGSLWRPCNICLDEMCQTELRTHDSCEDCLLCDTCIEMSCKHHGGSTLPCPVCQVSLSPSDLIPVEKRKSERPKARLLRVPLVFRLDQDGNNNNQRCMQLLGHPGLLALPSRVTPATLLRTISSRIPQNTQYTLLLVDGRGYNCSRCLFSSHCRGCEVLTDTKEICLQAGDTVCVRFTSLTAEQIHSLADAEEHPSLGHLRQNDPLTIYDCLRSFTQSETLEESECWHCPVCERKQPATKTISVWKYPPYLILHLERFLFHGTMSTKLDDKVIYPLDGLDVSDYVSGHDDGTHLYNLYGVVCHTGVAQAGHYTAFARSPVTGDWHYFNDDTVTRQKPREEEYSTAYLLFYHKQGTNFDLPLPQRFAFIEDTLSKSNLCENSSNVTDDVVACSSTQLVYGCNNLDASLQSTQSEEEKNQQPVLQLNKLIENISPDHCDNLSDSIETDDPMVLEE